MRRLNLCYQILIHPGLASSRVLDILHMGKMVARECRQSSCEHPHPHLLCQRGSTCHKHDVFLHAMTCFT